MGYLFINYALMLACELLSIRAMCAVLRLRNNRVFVIVMLARAIIAIILREVADQVILRSIFGTLFTLFFPVWYSVGSLRTRFTRSVLVNLSIIIAELLASLVYSVVSHGAIHPQEVNAETIVPIILVYALIVPLSAAILEAAIWFCRRSDLGEEGGFSPTILMLLGGSLTFFVLVYVRIYATSSLSNFSGVTLLLYALLSLALGYAMLGVAQRDAQAQRVVAERAAMARQLKHLRVQIDAMTRSSVSVRLLRHDLANQVRVVRQLAAKGSVADADRYLATLQERARKVAEGEEG